MNGFDTTLATNPAVVTLSTPTTGNYTGSAYVKATVSKPISTMFLGAFRSSWTTMQVSASAIAGGNETSQTCVCVGGGSGTTLTIGNGSTLNANGCGIVANSTASNAITVSGGSTLDALSVGTVSSSWTSSANVTGGSTYNVTDTVTGTSSSCSPTLPTAPSYTAGSCLSDPGGSYGTFTFGPASASSVICYNALTVGANGSTCTLSPGIYVINGGELHFESGSGGYSNQGGQGVFFYLVGSASLVIDNGANIDLVSGGATESGGGAAPTVGTYNGILIYQVSTDTSAITIAGGSSSYMNGAIYAPGATVTMSNGTDTNVKGGIYASSLSLEGGSTFTPIADASQGSLNIAGSPVLLQ
jgi:hypothetical protein